MTRTFETHYSRQECVGGTSWPIHAPSPRNTNAITGCHFVVDPALVSCLKQGASPTSFPSSPLPRYFLLSTTLTVGTRSRSVPLPLPLFLSPSHDIGIGQCILLSCFVNADVGLIPLFLPTRIAFTRPCPLHANATHALHHQALLFQQWNPIDFI